VAHIEIDYKKPALPEDLLRIETRPIKKGTVSGVMQQKILRGEELIAEAKVTWAFVNAEGHPTRLPPRWDVPGLYPFFPHQA